MAGFWPGHPRCAMSAETSQSCVGACWRKFPPEHCCSWLNRRGSPQLTEAVMTAMDKVPRHEFVPVELQPLAYANIPLPIGFDKTVSQPFIVALMTDLLDIGADEVDLEIGAGLGYQAAILAQLARKSTASKSSKSSATAKLQLRERAVATSSYKITPMAIIAGPSTPRSTR